MRKANEVSVVEGEGGLVQQGRAKRGPLRSLAALVAVALAACGSPYKTGAADLTSISPTVQSAGAVSFTMADGAGNSVLGWELQFFANGAGYDCLSNNADEVADVFIFTQQTTGDRATLVPSEVSIVPDNPPTATGNAVAHMAVNGIKQINGVLDLTDVHVNTSSNDIDRFEGTVTAAGTSDATGAGVNITGNFIAPVCE